MGSNRRQQLYDRIRASSKDELILEEMKRLGFWPDDQNRPQASETIIQRKGELQRELNELLKRQRLYQDPEQALKAMRKQRMAESKQRRIENKQRRLQEKHDKALRWHQRRQQETLYLGAGVSTGLNHVVSDQEKLTRHGLPLCASAKDIADAMGISLTELRFLSYTRDISRISHYQRFTIPKKSGGERLISAPMPRLKRVQYWILDNILEKIPLHAAAHGFRRGCSIVSNAEPHTGAQVVLNSDLKDFFPTLNYPRIKGLFKSLGYSNQVATVFALLCTEPDIQQVILDGERYFVRIGERSLPQGAPSSPAITNIICRRLDRRLAGAARTLGFAYTRYADDMSFSGSGSSAKKLGKLQWRLAKIVQEEGFQLHPDKTRAMRANSRQEVTGIVVNEKPSLERKTLRRFRALLHQIEKDGPAGKQWGRAHNVLDAVKGFANYVSMVDPPKGRRFRLQIDRIIQRHRHHTPNNPLTPLNRSLFRSAAAAGKPPRTTWWQPVERPMPVMPTLDAKKKPELADAKQGTRPTTRRLIAEAEAGRSQIRIRPGQGFWWRLLGRLAPLFWLLIFLSILLYLLRVSPFLGIAFFVAVLYFRKRLRG